MSSEIIMSEIQRPTIELTTDAINRRNVAMVAAKSVLSVRTADEQADAVKAMQGLKSVAKGVESSRELVKKPVLEISRLIDGTAKDFLAPINTELKRLDVLVSEFQRAEMARVAAEQEAERLKRLKLMEEQEKLEAEASKSKSMVKKLEALAKAEEAEAAMIQSAAVSIAAAPERVAGMVVRKQWEFEVTDIRALAQAKPDWVIITENRQVINAMIRQGGIRECPGLRIFETVKTGVRA